MSEINVDDWKLKARAVVKLRRKNNDTLVSSLFWLYFVETITAYYVNGDA